MRYRSLTASRPPPARHAPDLVLLAAFGVLVVFGLLALASASSADSFERYGNAYRVVLHQLWFGALPGVALLGGFLVMDYRVLQRYAWLFLVVTVGLLAAVFVPGLGQIKNGARSWLGIGPLSFQPAEIVKLTALVWLAAYFDRIGYHGVRSWNKGLVVFAAVAGATVGLIARQPDLGTMVVVGAILLSAYFVAGARWQHLGVLTCAALAGVIAIIRQGGYRLQRLLVFLQPELDPQNTGYHISQALVAIGSGGLLGRGFGKSHQKFSYLPEVSADSIFAVMAEELGFVVAAGLVALIAVVVLRALAVARAAPDPFGRFLAAGIATWFGVQAFLNIAVISGLAPLTGLPLPFISAGGTALASNLAAAGILLNISRYTRT